MGLAADRRTLKTVDKFPGFHKAPAFLANLIKRHGAKSVVDIGGGAKPLLGPDLIGDLGLDYTVVDISQAELDKAPGRHRRICMDIGAPAEAFAAGMPPGQVDLVFSHMVLEHVRDILQAHANVHHMLKPGGIAIHMFPCPNNLPLIFNRILPGRFSAVFAGLVSKGRPGKFRAYYKLCGPPSTKRADLIQKIGFNVLEYTGFVGHSYYRRIPGLRVIERHLRRPLAESGIPLIGDILLILEKN